MSDSSSIVISPAAMAIIGSLFLGLVGCVKFLFDMVIKAKEKENALALAEKDLANTDIRKERDSQRSMLALLITNFEIAANEIRKTRGESPIAKVSAVIPESNSPPTVKQIETADLATMRARITAASESIGLPVKVDPGSASPETAFNIKNTMDDYLRGHNPDPAGLTPSAPVPSNPSDEVMHVIVDNPKDNPVPVKQDPR